MTLTCEKPYQKRTWAPGVYINEVTVADVEDISGTTPTFMQRPVDIGLKLKLDVGRDFQPELTVAGSFKTDPESREVIGWGSAFVVQEALTCLGYNGPLEEGNRIPPDTLQGLIGKHFLRLTYVSGRKDSGKLRYSDWSTLGRVEDGPQELLRRWKRSLNKGYPRNYRPEVLDEPAEAPQAPPMHEDDVF